MASPEGFCTTQWSLEIHQLHHTLPTVCRLRLVPMPKGAPAIKSLASSCALLSCSPLPYGLFLTSCLSAVLWKAAISTGCLPWPTCLQGRGDTKIVKTAWQAGHRKTQIKCELHLPIFTHWWGHRKWLCEAFFSNQPEVLFSAFALIIENTGNLKHAI